MSDKIRGTHLERRAIVYLRQSTLKQLREHRESTARQYGLKERAIRLGWTDALIVVIDEDLGQSGASAEWRRGFQRLAEDVAHGRVGIIFALEVSRLARSSADWHHLLELCGLADVLIADEQAVYNPRDYNDRLLLGLKGTMSEAEQYWMRLRLEGGRLSKARRGEMPFCPPAGYEWDEALSRFRLDPDERVQRAVRLVFERFRLDGSAYGVTRYFAQAGLLMPARDLTTRTLHWAPARPTLVQSILHNPIYAGAYVFGRHEERMGLVDGKVRRRQRRKLPRESWKSVLLDQHPAYITWEEFMANEKRLDDNRTKPRSACAHGAPREGRGLLQGLVLCGRCGHRMSTRYRDAGGHAQYQCRANFSLPQATCWTVAAQRIDQAVEGLFLAALQPPEVELALAVAREAERQGEEIDRQWKARLERIQYEAQLAERRYKAIDPDNRVVARTLEREWEEKLRELEEATQEQQEVRRREKVELTDADRDRILALARDLPAVWKAATTTQAERKNLLRMLVREVTLSPVDVPRRMTRVQVWWQTGAVSEISVPRHDQHRGRVTPDDVVAVVEELFVAGQGDDEIATELNRRGLPREIRRPWDVPAVQRIRYNHGLYRPSPTARRAPDQRPDGLYSLHGVSRELGVLRGTVKYWVATGLLVPAVGGGTGHAWYFRLDDETRHRLSTAKTKRFGNDVTTQTGATLAPAPPTCETDLPDTLVSVSHKG